jgi:hypothetical protein
MLPGGVPQFRAWGILRGSVPPALFLTDGFVQLGYISDPIGKFDVRLLHLLHEVLHVADRLHGYSSRQAFADARIQTLARVDVRACGRLFARWKRDSQRGIDQAVWTRSRLEIQKLGLRIGGGRRLASAAMCIEGAEGPLEAFAEAGSYWLIDPMAANYFPAPMATWLAAVFPNP